MRFLLKISNFNWKRPTLLIHLKANTDIIFLLSKPPTLHKHFIITNQTTFVGIVKSQWIYPDRDIRISNQFLITRALHFAQPQAYYQASVTIKLGRRV